jgi:hypothetical protein
MNFSASFITLLLVISLLVFAVLINTTVIYAQQIATKTQQTPSSSSTPKLHAIKITSPTKGQEVSIGKDLTVSGIYTTGNATTSHCQVFVIANGVKPYQPATAAGTGGAAGYSKWNFVLTSKYTTIKQGPNNKITAKYVCSDNPSIASFYSVNITGVETTTKQQQQNVTTATNNNNPVLTPQNKPVVFNNTRSTIQPYSISKNVNQSINATFLGNGVINNTSGIEYLGYHEPSSVSKNYSPIATGSSGSISNSSSYNRGFGSRSVVPTQQGTSLTMDDNTNIDALFPIGNNSTSIAESASREGGSTKFGFDIFPFDGQYR